MSTITAPPQRMLTPARLSAWLDTPVATLKDWRKAGRGPGFIKTGQTVRYPREAVDAWIAQGGDIQSDDARGGSRGGPA